MELKRGDILASYYLHNFRTRELKPTGNLYKVIGFTAERVKTEMIEGEWVGKNFFFEKEHIPSQYLRIKKFAK